MKTPNKFGYTTVVADILGKGYCKILVNDCGVIVKAHVGSSSTENCEVYSATTPDSCWKNSMEEMLSLSTSCFIELFNTLKCTEQISYAKEIAANQATLLACQADDLLEESAQLHVIATHA